MKTLIPSFDSFNEFYTELVIPLKKKNPEFIRLDGKITGSTRNPAAYFMYKSNKWKVDADTYLDRLTIAFDKMEAGEDPFLIKPTLNKKGECLIIKDESLKNKKFYVYKVP